MTWYNTGNKVFRDDDSLVTECASEQDAVNLCVGVNLKLNEREVAAHDLIFFSKRSTPLVVSKGAPASSNSNYSAGKYGQQTSRRAATPEEEKKIASGGWLRVDSKGNKPSSDKYKKTKYRPWLNK